MIATTSVEAMVESAAARLRNAQRAAIDLALPTFGAFLSDAEARLDARVAGLRSGAGPREGVSQRAPLLMPATPTVPQALGMAEGFLNTLTAWKDVTATADEYRELDDRRVLALDRRSARGKTSGLELEELRTEGATLWHVHDGKVVKLVLYWDRERALADLGLKG